MPELPEVETSRRGIEPHILGRRIARLVVRERRLRQPIPAGMEEAVAGLRIQGLERRAKYLLLALGHGHGHDNDNDNDNDHDHDHDHDQGTILIHLGMSGSLRVVPADTPARKHDHVDLVLDSGQALRLHDPRRFGSFLWITGPPEEHPLLNHLGPEPLSSAFTGRYLHNLAQGRRAAIKTLLMDSRIVVGVGNIYANEALFGTRIHPSRAAGRVSRERYDRLAAEIKRVLAAAVEQGGTTLRDFVQEDGNPGYFAQRLCVYGREGEPCPACGEPIRQKRIGQRSSFYCAHCQR